MSAAGEAIDLLIEGGALVAAELPELAKLLTAVSNAISQKTQLATDRAVVEGADDAADIAERAKFGS